MMELKLTNLTKNYGGLQALRDFSATLAPGIYGLFNGKLAFTNGEGTYFCDLDGQNVQKIWDQWGILLADNEYLLVDNTCNFSVMDGTVPRTIAAIDAEGHVIGSIDLDGYVIDPIGLVDGMYLVPDINYEKQSIQIYKIPVEKIADGTGQPEVFFEYMPEE